MDPRDLVFTPGQIGSLRLRNRILRSGCFEGLCPDGKPTDALIEHHRRIAAGGAALTTVSYCSVSEDGRSYGTEMWMRESILPDLRRLTRAVHAKGAAASLQLGHCGYFSDPAVIRGRTIGVSRVFNRFRPAYPRVMTADDMARVARDFAASARMAAEAGFDAVEVHAGHGYLLSQFLSPYTNRRTDDWGGSLAARARFPGDVVRAVRVAVGPGFPVLVKMNLFDGFRGGFDLAEAADLAAAFESAGASALVPSCGFTSRTPFFMLRGRVPIREMVRNQERLLHRVGLTLFGRLFVREYPYTDLFLLQDAKRLVGKVGIPIALVGGVGLTEHVAKAREAGFGFAVMGRALIRDPDLPRKMESGRVEYPGCDHCNRCVAAMDGGGVRCVTMWECGGLPPL